jgi:acyl-coenzyme A synthetase/AMP-(fatty) acid ligase/acyl carrier protein
MISHAAILNTLSWRLSAFSLKETDSILQNLPCSSDPSVWQIFGALLAGARLELVPPELHRDTSYLIRTILDRNITITDFVPSMLQVVLKEPELEKCKSLRHVFCGGEAMSRELVRGFFERLDANLHNMYGPTETAIDAISWPVQRDSHLHFVPIGRPIFNVEIYLLDKRMHPIPIGAAGELYIGSRGQARGYLDRPDLTAGQFIPHPFSYRPGARLYRTGDLARYLPDGTLEFLGRSDRQVKVRGYRVELGEIEAALAQHESVAECAVVAREDVPGEKRLVAYIVPSQDQAPAPVELRSFLREKLPEFMLPSAFISQEKLPILPSGKLDRRALPAPNGTRPDTTEGFIAPRSSLEEKLVEIWAEALRIEKVGIYDNFFDLGGHSLILVQVHRKLREAFEKEVSMVDLFRYPTISALAEFFNVEQNGQGKIPQERNRMMRRKQAAKQRQMKEIRRADRKSQEPAYE